MKNLNLKNTISVALVATFASLFIACGEDLMKGQPEGVVKVLKLTKEEPLFTKEYFVPLNAQDEIHGNFKRLMGELRQEAGFDKGVITYYKQYTSPTDESSLEISITCNNGKFDKQILNKMHFDESGKLIDNNTQEAVNNFYDRACQGLNIGLNEVKTLRGQK